MAHVCAPRRLAREPFHFHLTPRYTSTATLYLSPRQPLEGYLLATQELTRHYAVRLVAPARVTRAVALAQSVTPLNVEAVGASGMQVQLTVTHRDPAPLKISPPTY